MKSFIVAVVGLAVAVVSGVAWARTRQDATKEAAPASADTEGPEVEGELRHRARASGGTSRGPRSTSTPT